MRNLKRALSLTLASVMLLGMMVIGSSAAQGYPDVDENDNVEAIEVLQAIAVMVGDAETGNFRPDAPVSRAEMAVVMGLLLNLDYNYYVSTCPFADVSGNYEWARGWVGACAANGIIAGRSATSYDPGATVTAIEAASMMMRALGYFQNPEDYADGFQVVTVRQGSQIGIFSGIGSDATTPMTRNQVAQLALNALRSNMVTFTGSLGVEVNGVKVSYRAEYTPRTSPEAKYNAIANLATTIQHDNGQYYIQLGEQLYDGKLKLNDNAEDDFGRPSRKWEYDGKAIGTYAKEELIRGEYTTEVTGKTLYDLLGADTIKNYTVSIYIDGVDTQADNAKKILDDAWFSTVDMNRNNDKGVGATGNGVLTQVFVDDEADTVDISIINTYLAFADEDYDDRTEEVDITVYGLDTVEKEYVKTLTDNNDYVGFTLAGEDFVLVPDVQEGDPLLVTVAQGVVQSVAVPEVLANSTINAFKVNSNVTVEGTKYDYSSAAEYDWEVLDVYTGNNGTVNLKDIEYNVYLDKYGYAIGVDIVEAANNYVFITALKREGSTLVNTTAQANAIFLEGDMKTINIDVAKSSLHSNSDGRDSILNTWCTYTVNGDVYTVKEVARATQASYNGGAAIVTGVPGGTTNGTKIAQAWTPAQASTTFEINRTHLSLVGGGNTTVGYNKVYGNDNTVYITVKLDELDHDSNGGADAYGAISGVGSVITGVRNADLKVWSLDDAYNQAEDTNRQGSVVKNNTNLTNGVYALYGKDGYVIAAIVAGDDGSSSKNLVYVHSGSVTEESYDPSTDKHTWIREVALDGKKVEIREVSNESEYLENMQQHHWYQVSYNANEEVIGIYDWSGLTTAAPFTPVPNWSLTDAVSAGAGDEGDYVMNIQWLEACLDEYDEVLYEQSFTDDHPTMDVKKGNTLYVSTKEEEGVWVNDDVNILLIQYEKNKLVPTFTSGASRLDKIVRDLNSANGNEYDYTISAIVDGTGATTVVIYDRTNTYERPEEPTEPKDPSTNIDGIYVDLRNLSDILVNTTEATMDDADGHAAVIAALEAAGYTLPDAGETNAPEVDSNGVLTGKATKGGITYPYKWDPKDTGGKDKGLSGKAFTIDEVEKITNSTSTSTIKAELGWPGSAISTATEYVRYSTDGGKTWTYVTNDSSTSITDGMIIQTGWYKVQVGSAAITNDTNLDRTKSNIVTDGTDTFALGTSSAVEGSAATGTGLKVGSSVYYAYGSTFADIYKGCGAASGVIDMTINQVKLTIIDDTVGGESTTVKPVAYGTTAADKSSDIGSAGTMMYVDGDSTAVAVSSDLAYDKDHTVRVGYVKVGDNAFDGDAALGHTINRSYNNAALTSSTILKVGDKVTATVTIASAGTALDAADTITFGASAIKGYPNGTLTTAGGTQNSNDFVAATGVLTIPTSTTAVSGSISVEYTVGTTDFDQDIVISHS